MTLQFGGSFLPPSNIKNEVGFDYLIEVVRTKCFGVEMYPTLFDKASAYMFFINSDHVFHDGNKRTGLSSSLLFLELNGFVLKDISDQDLIKLALQVATHEINKEDLAKWFKDNTILKSNT